MASAKLLAPGLLTMLDSHSKGFVMYTSYLVISYMFLIFCGIADVSLKEAKMSEGALKSNYSKASITQMAWTTARTETDYTSRLSHMSRMRDQKKLQ